MTGKVLRVNLSSGDIGTFELPPSAIRDYIGGRGLGAYLLYKHFKAGTDALDEENVVVFTIGPFQGTKMHYSPKCVLTTKSPLTNRILFSIASGEIGQVMAKAGYAGIVILGKASEPSYIRIEDGDVCIMSAEKLWGLTTIEGQKRMLEDAGLTDRLSTSLCIGPSGENLVRIAIVVTGGDKGRSFGRGGCGAVLGSKNLKGIAIRGTGEVAVAHPERFDEGKHQIMANIKTHDNWAKRHRNGTGGDTKHMSDLGILPTRNWSTGVFPETEAISFPDADEKVWDRKNVTCGPYCPTPCAHIGKIKSGPWEGAVTRGPEYETIYAYGPNCGITSLGAIVAAEEICDEYGLDTMSCGCTIAFAMECYEKGYITKEDTDGVELKFGNDEAIVEMTRKVALGEGFGKLLGEGSRIVSTKIGSPDFAMHCKGLEFGGYECRGMWGQALAYSLASRGGCHHAFGLPARSPSDMTEGTKLEGKGALVKRGACSRIVFDSAVICAFPQLVLGGILRDLVNSVSEYDYTPEEFERVGHRVATLERMFNLREGGGRQDDYLPKRLREEPMPDGPKKGLSVPMDALLDEGYKSFGWDIENGVPTKELIESLGLAWAAE